MAHRVGNLVQGVGKSAVSVVGAGALRLGTSSDPIELRLSRLALAIRGLLEEYRPTCVALEEAYFGKSVQSALRIGEARGVILAEAATAGISIQQFPPARIKRVVTGSGSADKERVRDMVQMSLGMSEAPETMDVTDALAVGLCCIEDTRNIHLGSG